MLTTQMPIRKLKSSHYSEIKYFNTVSQTIIKGSELHCWEKRNTERQTTIFGIVLISYTIYCTFYQPVYSVSNLTNQSKKNPIKRHVCEMAAGGGRKQVEEGMRTRQRDRPLLSQKRLRKEMK